MRNSVAEIEKTLTILHREMNFDQQFLTGLIDHKNNTIAWLRERQVKELELMSKMYDDMVATIMGEIVILEKHMATYEKGTPHENAK